MDVSPIAAAPNQPSAPSVGGALKADADFETFLKLLTTQLTNQDPLNPADSTEFVAQLAQFSSVEQQIRTNTMLENIAAGLSGAEDLTGWLGAEALSAGPQIFSGAPVSLRRPDGEPALAETLIVRDASGAIVARQAVTPGSEDIVWSGVLASGDPAPQGRYRFEIERRNPEGLLDPLAPLGFSKVAEVRAGDAGPQLLLENGEAVRAQDVPAVRAAARDRA